MYKFKTVIYILMQRVVSHVLSSPEMEAFFLSRITYWWFKRVVMVGQRRPLQLEDLSPVSQQDSVQNVCCTFEEHWKNQLDARWNEMQKSSYGTSAVVHLFSAPFRSGLSLLHALWLTFLRALLQVTLLRLLTDLSGLLIPLVLRCVILFSENQPEFDWAERTYALVLLGTVVSRSLVEQQFEKHSRMTAAKVQTALTSTLHRKALSLSSSSRHNLCPGAACLSADVKRVAGLVVMLPQLLSSPLRVALCVWLLWRELGPAALVGVAMLLFLIPAGAAAERRVSELQKSKTTFRKKRGALLSEMVTEMKMLKQLVWEGWFQHRVTVSRERELETLRILGYLTAFSMLNDICVPFLVCLSSFGAFVLMDDGHVLTSAQVFTTIYLHRLLRPLLLDIPNLSPLLTQAKNSLCRLELYLLTECPTPDCCHETFTQDNTEEMFTCSHIENFSRNSDVHFSEMEVKMEPPTPTGSWMDVRLYLQTFGCCWALLCLAAQLGLVLVALGQDALLGLWTSDAKEVQSLEDWKELRNSRLSFYALLGLIQALLVCTAAKCVTKGSLRASERLHSELLSNVLHLPLTFFQTSPPEQVLHSFTQDMSVVDEQVSKCLCLWLNSLLETSAACLLISFISPIFILVASPVVALLVMLQVLSFFWFVSPSQSAPVSRQIKDLEASARCSVTLLLRESLCADVATAAFSLQQCSPSRCHRALHGQLLTQYNHIIMDRWVALRIDGLAAILVFMVTFILLVNLDTADPGIVGFALMHALNVRDNLHKYMEASCGLQDCARTLKRIAEYTVMKKEASWVQPNSAPNGWPEHGQIEFRDYRADDSKATLVAFRGLSFSTQSREKVIVLVSEWAQAEALVGFLFRTLEGTSGLLLLDRVDVSTLGLHELRCQMNIVPQVPVLFSGSLRANLDPAARLSDAQVWQALELCHLKECVQQLPGQLLHLLQKGKDSLSMGQRRLLCVARALLRKSRVLLVEEAPSSVEPEAEHLVQQVIRREFSSCTVLIVTQNPQAVIVSDRVLVLGQCGV
ncbi:canalicular multispecific organic anion transporter 2 [Denticeps clupeoides]|uniref:canalicular multispecific organic anion transporter 2 n=1 Tax=Denticeps clupeoides TaxID=299321 RepID=UPI0010A2EF47|nr:canalicular multispecific organic anion transporter 2-like [Denticeps clupeoides]